MNRVVLAFPALLCLLRAGGAHTMETWSGCLRPASVPMMVRIGDAPPVDVVLEGGIETPLSLFEAGTRRLLWSAGQTAATQVFAGMDAAILGSLGVIDLDADGLHDRIYAGDVAGRLWRFDLHHGAAAGQWASGGIFADFANAEGRGFLAAPDVSLSAPDGWLNIAIGTAAPGNAGANNRFYALRDHAVHETWTQEDYADWRPLKEEDLVRIEATAGSLGEAVQVPDTGPGWYVELGSGHVVTPALTVNHRAVLAIAAVLPARDGPCEVFTRIASFDLARPGVISSPGSVDWRSPLPLPVSLDTSFTLDFIQGAATAACTLGGQRVAACDVDVRPRRTWWRREDAE